MYIEENDDVSNENNNNDIYIKNRGNGDKNSIFIGSTFIKSDVCYEEADVDCDCNKDAEKAGYVDNASKSKTFHVNMAKNLQDNGEGLVGIDSMAEVSIFKRNMMLSIEPCAPIIVYGINSAGQPLHIQERGFSILGIEGYVCDDISLNILSLGDAKDQGNDLIFDYDKDMFKMQAYKGGQWFKFDRDHKRGENLYLCDIHSQRRHVFITTVADRLKLYSKQEIQRANKARQIQRRLGFVNKDRLIEMISKGVLLNCSIGKKDILRADDIYGQDIGELKGKSTQSKAPTVQQQDKIRENIQIQEQVASCDLMHLNGRAFLVTVFSTTEFTMVSRIKSKGGRDIMPALRQHISEMKKQGFKVTTLRVDGESGIVTDKENVIELNNMGVTVDPCVSGDHIPNVERKIRTIKERVRCMASVLPFELCNKLEDMLVKWSVSRINLEVTVNTTEYTCPREKVYNIRTDVERETKHEFGEYVQLIEGKGDSERSRGAVALLPTGNSDGSWYYYVLSNGGIASRRRASTLPMPAEVITRLNQLANNDRGAVADNIRRNRNRNARNAWEITYGESENDLNIYIGDVDSENIENGKLSAIETRTIIGEASGPIEYDIEEELEHAGDESGKSEANSTVQGELIDNKIPEDDWSMFGLPIEQNEPESVQNDEDIFINDIANEINIISDNFLNNEQNGDLDFNLRGNVSDNEESGGTESTVTEKDTKEFVNVWADRLRPRDPNRAKYTNRLVGMLKLVFKTTAKPNNKNMSITRAVDKLGSSATEAISKEMNMIINEKKVFEAVDVGKLTFEERKSIIPSKLFLKEKYTATGEFDKLKARLVAGGHRQDRDVFDNISSSTVSTSSVMMVAAIAAMEKRSVAVVDFPGAYLNSVLPDDHPPVYMKLNKDLARYATIINPNYKTYIREDGSLVVKLKKALYGCVQSAKVWYDTLTGKLSELGYTKNKADECVFNKVDHSGNQVTIVVHVDDILITATGDHSLDVELQLLEGKFGELTIDKGPVVNYLGMTMDFRGNNGKVKVTMKGFIDEFLNDMDGIIDGVSDVPAAKNLFDPGSTSTISKDRGEFYHSTVAKLLYLAKRVRPDILLAISYLTKRVQCPNELDYKKLCKVVRYLRGSRDLGITLEAYSIICVLAYIDASHAIHINHRGHTGTILSVGRGPIYVKSSSQKINTKSSTETELVGLTDGVGQVIWTREFLMEQGYAVEPATIFQDNQSTMHLVKNGKSNSERTKHIATRFYFIKDRVDRKEVKIEYLATGQMIADILTKPLTGALFIRLRQLLLNN